MSQRKGKGNEHAWIRMNDTTWDGCKMAGQDVKSAAPDSVADKMDETTDDQVLNEASNNANTLENAREQSVSPEATSKPIVYHCLCTRNQTGLPNDKHTVKLRGDINNASRNYNLSPDSQVLLPGNSLLGGSPQSFSRSLDFWNMPRTLPYELPQSLDDLTYPSEEETTSNDGGSDYGLQFDTNEPTDQGPSEDEEPDLQDVPDAKGSGMEDRQN